MAIYVKHWVLSVKIHYFKYNIRLYNKKFIKITEKAQKNNQAT